MKKIATIFVLAAFLCGCTKEISNNKNSEDLILAKLVFSGEVSIDEEPLTKAGESNALLGIQVYQGGSPYAYGLFDTIEDIGLCLHSGAEYSVICQYIKNGKEILYHFKGNEDAKLPTYILSDYDSYRKGYRKLSWGPGVARKIYQSKEVFYSFLIYSNGFCMPFDIIGNYSAANSEDELWCWNYSSGGEKLGYNYIRYYTNDTIRKEQTHNVCAITNRFTYDNVNTMNITESNVIRNESSSEDIDRYYGESDTFIASPGSRTTIVLNMKHLVYGLQCNVTGVSDGTASVTIKNGDNTLLEKTDISGEYHSEKMMFAVADMHSAWQYSDDYAENVTVSLTWHRGVGVTQDLGSAVVQVKRNCMNVINVSLSTATKACATFGVESEQSDMNIINIDNNTHF